jgi:hypothetical protein
MVHPNGLPVSPCSPAVRRILLKAHVRRAPIKCRAAVTALALCGLAVCQGGVSLQQEQSVVVTGQVFVHTSGGMPPAFVNSVVPLRNAECIRVYSDTLFDSSSGFVAVVTDSNGGYRYETLDRVFAIAIVWACTDGYGVTIIDTLRDVGYTVLHLIEIEGAERDSIEFSDTVSCSLPS